MRLAFWRAGKDKAVVQRAIAKPAIAKPAPAVAKPVVAKQLPRRKPAISTCMRSARR